MMKKLAILVILVVLAISCSKGKESEPITKEPVKANPMEGISLAKVNNSSISAEDLRNEFNMLSPQAQQMFMTQGGFDALLDELIKKEMLYQEARKKDYTSDEEFKDIMDDYRKRVMIGFLLKDEVESKSQVTDDEVRKYYDDNRKDFLLETPEKGEQDVIDFDSVKGLIRQRLEAKKQTDVFESYITKLKGSYNVSIDNAAFTATFGNITSPPEANMAIEQEKGQ
jgi:hypothetical protein